MPSAVEIPITTKLKFLIGEVIWQFTLSRRALPVTKVAGPVKNGAGAPINQANIAPIVPIDMVIKVLIRIHMFIKFVLMCPLTKSRNFYSLILNTFFSMENTQSRLLLFSTGLLKFQVIKLYEINST